MLSTEVTGNAAEGWKGPVLCPVGCTPEQKSWGYFPVLFEDEIWVQTVLAQLIPKLVQSTGGMSSAEK